MRITPITARFIAKAVGDHLEADGEADEGDLMSYLAKPKFHHPDLPKNSLGYTHRDYEGTVSTLCAGCGLNLDHGRDYPGLLRTVDRAAPGCQDLWDWLLVEDADLFPRQFARL